MSIVLHNFSRWVKYIFLFLQKHFDVKININKTIHYHPYKARIQIITGLLFLL